MNWAIDKELAHVYLYRYHSAFDEFVLQQEEVSGMFKAEFEDFCALMIGDTNQIQIQGFVDDHNGKRNLVTKMAGEEQFVPHEKSFYHTIIKRIREKLVVDK